MHVDAQFQGEACRGQLERVKFRGAQVELQVGFARFPLAPLDEPLELALRGGTSGTLRASARLLLQCESETGVVCRFALAQTNALRSALNRRRAYRVRPGSSAPVELALAGGLELHARDLSTGGVLVMLPREEQARLPRAARTALELRLPGRARAHEYAVRIVYRQLVGSWVRCGLHFDAQATVDFEQREAELQAYVVERQLEVLRTRDDEAA